MPDSEAFKLILQLGSFGLLAIIVVWLLWKGAPLLRGLIEGVVEKFDAALDKQAAQHEKQLARRDAADEKRTAALEKLADVVEKLSDRVEVIERRTDEYPTPQPKPRRPNREE